MPTNYPKKHFYMKEGTRHISKFKTNSVLKYICFLFDSVKIEIMRYIAANICFKKPKVIAQAIAVKHLLT